MRLFRRTRDHSSGAVTRMVEAALSELSLDPATCRNNEGPEDAPHLAWNFTTQSDHEVVLILGAVDDETMVLQARCLVAKIPQEGVLPFYRRLLELNAEELTLASFGISGQYAVLSTDRPTKDLDSSEILEMISAVAGYAEKYATDLKEEFACPDWDDD
jgi:hypothetical protein